MGFVDSVKSQMRPAAEARSTGVDEVEADAQSTMAGGVEKAAPHDSADQQAGVATIEAAQAIWGKTGRYLIIAGLAMIMIIYELDNSTVYIYNNYSTSSFGALSTLSTLSTAGTIVFAVVKPPIAKLSDIFGRGPVYLGTISFYVLAYIVMASAKSINSYAAGTVFYSIGQSGTNIMNDIVISDITTARWRAFAIGLAFFPFLITPWVAAYIVDSVVAGIGWRWGIGMFAILMPFGSSFLVSTLIYYQRRARKMRLVRTAGLTVYGFCSQIDLGGTFLFCAGLALLLLPMTLASTTPSQWKTPWLIALIVLGGVLLILLVLYEHFVARHPLLPTSYFRNPTIMLCLFLIATDSLGFNCTHTYLYAWSTVTHDFSARVATFFIYTNGVTQALFGILAGLVVSKTRNYKYLAIAAACIRLVGYGIMLRLRGASNSTGDLFAQQLIQGIGSGIVQTVLLVPCQVSVPHSQMAQITALVVCISTVGGSVGACVAGGIYTNTLKRELARYLGSDATPTLIDQLYGSITGTLPAWGSPQRVAINLAYSQVLKYMTYVALGSAAPSIIVTLFMPNLKLPDRNNLVEGESYPPRKNRNRPGGTECLDGRG